MASFNFRMTVAKWWCLKSGTTTFSKMRLISIILAIVLSGCVAYSQTKQTAAIKVVESFGGKTTLTETIQTTETRVPDTATGKLQLNAAGVSIASSGIDYVKRNTWIFYAASVLLIAAGVVVGVWLREAMLGVSLAVAGCLAAALPSAMAPMAIMLAIAFGLCLFGGLTWAVAKYVFRVNLISRNKPAIAKLTSEKKPAEATAIARAIDDQLDKEFKKIKGK